MTFRFLQTSKIYFYKKEHLTLYPTAKSDIDSMIAWHTGLKEDEDGLPIIEINSIEELTKFIKEECKDEQVVIGYNEKYGGWYIEDYDSYRE